MNQHIPHLFRFTDAEWNHLEATYRERIRLISDFCAVEDPNFAIDEQWGRFYPYGQEAIGSEPIATNLILENHAEEAQTFRYAIRDGERTLLQGETLIEARATETIDLQFPVTAEGRELVVLTADISRESGHTREGHCETVILMDGAK